MCQMIRSLKVYYCQICIRFPSYQKRISTVRKQYYWLGMKKEVANFIDRCLECQKFKAKHIHLAGLL
jgi:hypothetical protein